MKHVKKFSIHVTLMKHYSLRTLIIPIQIIVVLFPILGRADTWTPKANFPGTARMYPVTFSIGTKCYMGTGSDANFTTVYSDLWEWDEQSNGWTQKASLPQASARVGAVAFTVGTKGYIATGYDGGSMSDVWQWDQSTNTWTRMNDFPGTARYDAIAFSIGSKAFLGTGSGPLNDFWEYDPVADNWTEKADLPSSPRLGAMGFAMQGKGYIGNGSAYNFTVFYNDFWEYDPNSDTWTQKANFAGGSRYYGVGFSVDSNGFVGTGIDSAGNYHSDVWSWNQSSNAWSQVSDFPGGGRGLEGGSGCCVIGSKAYFGTGIDPSGNLPNDFWEYDPMNSSKVSELPSQQNEIRVSPNPFSTGTMVYLPTDALTFVQFVLCDASGRVIKHLGTPNGYTWEIGMQELRESGSYYIRCTRTDGTIETAKLIFQK